jgi:hypothetical protein
LIVEGMSFGEHALMQDTGNQNAPAFLPVEQHVLAMFMPAQAGANVITGAA